MNYITKIEELRKEESELVADLKAQEQKLTDSVKNYLNNIKDDECLAVGTVSYSIGYDFKHFYISLDTNKYSFIDLYVKNDKIALNYGCYGEHTSDDKIPVSVALLVAKIWQNEKSLFNLINELLPDKEKVEKLKGIRDELYYINYELERLEKERKRADAIAKLKTNKYITFDNIHYYEIIRITEKTLILKCKDGCFTYREKLSDIINKIINSNATLTNENEEQ